MMAHLGTSGRCGVAALSCLLLGTASCQDDSTDQAAPSTEMIPRWVKRAEVEGLGVVEEATPPADDPGLWVFGADHAPSEVYLKGGVGDMTLGLGFIWTFEDNRIPDLREEIALELSKDLYGGRELPKRGMGVAHQGVRYFVESGVITMHFTEDPRLFVLEVAGAQLVHRDEPPDGSERTFGGPRSIRFEGRLGPRCASNDPADVAPTGEDPAVTFVGNGPVFCTWARQELVRKGWRAE